MRKRIVVLGSTGSIGESTLEVAAALGHEVQIVGLSAGRNWRSLAAQAQRFRPLAVAIADDSHFAELRDAVPTGTRVLAGGRGLVELVASCEAKFVVAAVVGVAGLPAVLAAVQLGLDVGLANKESLVVAGSLLMPMAARSGSRILPIDSEHSAIFQALHSGRAEEVRRVYLTASGGPFREWPAERLARVTLEDALRHPTWSMGPKITIDSATMMNKALEVIEAHHLFGVPVEKLEVLVHPESIVHSMVEFVDGSLIAQLGEPDMKTPIQYALTYPRRVAGPARALSWAQARTLRFEPPDTRRFPAIRLGFETARRGGSAGAVFNAANEAAVEQFRSRRTEFTWIAEVIERVLGRHRLIEQPTLEELLEADTWARGEVAACNGS